MELQGPDLTYYLKQLKAYKTCVMMVIKTLAYIRQRRTVINERWKTNEMSPILALSYCLIKVSILQHQKKIGKKQAEVLVKEAKLRIQTAGICRVE